MLPNELRVALAHDRAHDLRLAVRCRLIRKSFAVERERVGVTPAAVFLVVDRLHVPALGVRLVAARARKNLDFVVRPADAFRFEVYGMVQFDRGLVRLPAIQDAELGMAAEERVHTWIEF
jgi:hypothetical protein